jgi:hypothetical protein
MLYGTNQAAVEAAIFRAHRALRSAAYASELCANMESLGDDLREMMFHLQGIQEELLKDRAYRDSSRNIPLSIANPLKPIA